MLCQYFIMVFPILIHHLKANWIDWLACIATRSYDHTLFIRFDRVRYFNSVCTRDFESNVFRFQSSCINFTFLPSEFWKKDTNLKNTDLIYRFKMKIVLSWASYKIEFNYSVKIQEQKVNRVIYFFPKFSENYSPITLSYLYILHKVLFLTRILCFLINNTDSFFKTMIR